MPTSNEELLSAQLAHATYTQRYGAGLARRVLKLLGDSEKDLKQQITDRLGKITERGFDRGPVTTKRLNSLYEVISETRKTGFDNLQKALKSDLLDFADHESDFQRRVLEQVVPIPRGFNAPSRELLRSIVVSRPFQGRVLRQWVGDLADTDRKALLSAINIGLVEGESIPNIVKRVGDRLGITQAQATAIVRTAVNHVSNHAANEVAKANSDINKGVKWVSTLDGRTTALCRARDGKVYPLDSGPRPPGHFNCRSRIVPVLKSWQQLGLKGDDLPVGVRASMNGDVPGDITYGEWLRKQPRAFVFETLGRKKGQLFLDGDLAIDRFVDRAGAELSLVQLRARESAAWSKAFSAATEFPLPISMPEAISAVRTMAKDLKEHAIAIDGMGNVLVVAHGTAKKPQVQFSKDQRHTILQADGVSVVHSHPDNRPPSGVDVSMARDHVLTSMVVVGSTEPSMYSASNISMEVTMPVLYGIYLNADRETMKFLSNMVYKDGYSQEEYNALVDHTSNRLVSAMGLFTYQADRMDSHLESAISKVDTDGYEEFIQRMSAKLKP